jgi:hypothetical protein
LTLPGLSGPRPQTGKRFRKSDLIPVTHARPQRCRDVIQNQLLLRAGAFSAVRSVSARLRDICVSPAANGDYTLPWVQEWQ